MFSSESTLSIVLCDKSEYTRNKRLIWWWLENTLQKLFPSDLTYFWNAEITKIQVGFLLATNKQIYSYIHKKDALGKKIIKVLPILKFWFWLMKGMLSGSHIPIWPSPDSRQPLWEGQADLRWGCSIHTACMVQSSLASQAEPKKSTWNWKALGLEVRRSRHCRNLIRVVAMCERGRTHTTLSHRISKLTCTEICTTCWRWESVLV